jgi:hypothetical protein
MCTSARPFGPGGLRAASGTTRGEASATSVAPCAWGGRAASDAVQ